MSELLDCTTEEGRSAGVAAAAEAVAAGGLVVLPTDTVYGVGCDAFNGDAVAALLAAKGRGREMPPPVLVPNPRTLDGLARDVPDYARALVERFWPGPLTLVVKAQSSLLWDLGDTNGTVAVRMPADDVALQLLSVVGPMAVTSANLTGQPVAATAAEARQQLGEAVVVYLEAGDRGSRPASTIVDCLGEAPRIIRQGELGRAAIDASVLAGRNAAASAEPPAAGPAAPPVQDIPASPAATSPEPDRAPASSPDRRRGGPRIAGSRRRR